MKKTEYLEKLNKALYKLREEDRKQALEYYEELIDEHIEECKDEELAVSKAPSIEDAVNATYDDLPASKRMVARFSTGNKGFNICLAIILFPIWLPLGIVFFVLWGLSYFLIWLFTLVYFIILASIGISFIAVFAYIFVSIPIGISQTLIAIAGCFVLAGLLLFLIIGAKHVVKFAVKITALLSHGIKKIFVKEDK